MSPELQTFLAYVAVTFVESSDYPWWQVTGYRYVFFNDDGTPDGGTAEPLVIDGKPCANVTGKVRVEDPDAEGWKPWQDLTTELVHAGFEKLQAGPVEGLHESRRAALLGALAVLDAGRIDADDADVILQIAVLGTVVYG